jgi:hypothetical protein
MTKNEGGGMRHEGRGMNNEDGKRPSRRGGKLGEIRLEKETREHGMRDGGRARYTGMSTSVSTLPPTSLQLHPFPLTLLSDL